MSWKNNLELSDYTRAEFNEIQRKPRVWEEIVIVRKYSNVRCLALIGAKMTPKYRRCDIDVL